MNTRNLEPQRSDSEKVLNKIDNRDKTVRAIELVVLGILVAFSVYSSVSLQNIIQSNQTGALEARKANIARQEEQKSYLKCIILLRFDAPELQNKNVTREEVEKALDECAAKTGTK